MNEMEKRLQSLVRDVPDFPKKGIVFKDITTLISDAQALREANDLLAAPFKGKGIDVVVGMESRGFIFGVPVAERLGAGFVPVRKPGKLPAETVSEEYALEYGTDRLEMHKDAVKRGCKALVVDDLLATGGTAEAVVRMLKKLGAEVIGIAFVIELGFLDGRSKLKGLDVHSIMVF